MPTDRKASSSLSQPRRLAVRFALLTAVTLMLAGCKTDLYTKLTEREANEMVALLLDRGIDASRASGKDGSSSVQVEQARFAQSVELLKAGGYPRQSFTNMGEVFKGGGLIASPTEERARFVYALSEELSKTISGIDGVLSARIHVVLPKNDLLKQDATPSSASVFIRHDKDAPLKSLLPQIKMLVANSIEGLTYEKVSVVFVPVDRSQVTSAAAVASSQASAAAPSGIDPALAAAAGGSAGLALAGGGLWLLRRRERSAKAPVSTLGALEPASRTDAALPPPDGAATASLKRVA
jgi:type III secretion protein J